FELAREISIGRELMNGEWIVVFYNDGCADCDQLLADFKNRGLAAFGVSERYDVALIQIGANSGTLSRKIGDRKHVHGRLNPNRRWVVQTPVLLILENGKVIRQSM